jgi:hypothetical protein
MVLLGAVATVSVGQAPGDARRERQEEKLVRVGGRVVTRRELNAYTEAFYLTPELREDMARRPAIEREKFYDQTHRNALQVLIDRLLIVEAAREAYFGSDGNTDMLDRLVKMEEERLTAKRGSTLKLRRWLNGQGMGLEEWRTMMADQVLHQQYMTDKVTSRARVAPNEMRRYYAREAESLRQPRKLVYRLIIVDSEGCEDDAAERRKAERVLAAIRDGADFAATADEFSLDRDSRPGGLHEVEAPESPADWLPPVCRGLAEGQVSGLIETPGGCGIARFEKVIAGGVPPFVEAQQQIREILRRRKAEALREQILAELRRKVPVEYFPAGRRIAGLRRSGE